MSNLKSKLLASVGAAAMLLAPLAILPVNQLPAGYAAFAEKGGNGNGNGHSDNGGGHNDSGGGDSSKHEEKAAAREEVKVDKAEKSKNFHADLGRLNSLKRNVNGLMNSSDPHMAGIRDYVTANAALDAAEAGLADAQADFSAASAAFSALSAGLEGYDDFDYATATPDELQQRLIDLQALADNAEAQTEATQLEALLATDEFTAFDAAGAAVMDAEDNVAEAEVGTSDADLQAALVAAANKDGQITPEILAWAKTQLGID